jgi:hypothetical protein
MTNRLLTGSRVSLRTGNPIAVDGFELTLGTVASGRATCMKIEGVGPVVPHYLVHFDAEDAATFVPASKLTVLPSLTVAKNDTAADFFALDMFLRLVNDGAFTGAAVHAAAL